VVAVNLLELAGAFEEDEIEEMGRTRTLALKVDVAL
jgi:hypothetical protein